jgi:hypothetical protein
MRLRLRSVLIELWPLCVLVEDYSAWRLPLKSRIESNFATSEIEIRSWGDLELRRHLRALEQFLAPDACFAHIADLSLRRTQLTAFQSRGNVDGTDKVPFDHIV